MAIVLLAYSLSAYVFSGLACYFVFVRQGNQDCTASEFNLMLLSNLWIVVLWPLWIVKESFEDDCNTNMDQEHLVTNPDILIQTNEFYRQKKFNQN